jgi:hypothetical protein
MMMIGDVGGHMAEETGSNERVLALYRRFFGEPESEVEVYVGFALFFGGIAFGALGLALFVWSEIEGGLNLALRQIAIALAMLGLPAFVLSFVVLLPVDRRARYASTAGALFCVVAVGVFVFAYPENWNVKVGSRADYTTEGVTTYAAGLAVLVASAGAGLVEHRLESARTAREIREAEDREEESVTEEEVRRDIEEAMKDAELTWGGVERDDTKRITIETDDAGIDRSGFDVTAGNESRRGGEGVDDAVAGLRQLQGGEKKQGRGEAVDDQTAALRELRERQRAEQEAEPSFLQRVKRKLGL